jgi:hypothetical protein
VVFVDAVGGSVLSSRTLEHQKKTFTSRTPPTARTARKSAPISPTTGTRRTARRSSRTNGITSQYNTLSGQDLTDAQNAATFACDVYEYFINELDRDSWDDNGGMIPLFIDAQYSSPNAMYGGDCRRMAFSTGWVQLDVVGHEFTHGVVDFTAGLVYSDESCAMNESYADFFGNLIDGAGWLVGEDLPGGALRDMEDPQAYRDPDHYDDYVNTTGDNGGVHTNSGILNKLAFLITEGGTHHDITVAGIGRSKAARLYYDVLRSDLSTSARFAQLGTGLRVRAINYASTGEHNFTGQDACTVINALVAVGLSSVGDADCDGVLDTQDDDDDGDFIPDDQDNCPDGPNSDQSDSDNDGLGDACDIDLNNDGLDNGPDNCNWVHNPGQEDTDSDGFGDACDDNDDDDGVPYAQDNCISDYNPSQIETDGDGEGDACDSDDDNDGVQDTFENCPFHDNPLQGDDDRDGVGNECDNCRELPNPDQKDTDRDGRGDLCDDDIDNDGIPNEDDNCPERSNADQGDFDHDGVGSVCDEDEVEFLLDGFIDAAAKAEVKFGPDPFEPLVFPLTPCSQFDCPDVLPEDFLTRVEVSLPFEATVVIVDDRGNVLAKGQTIIGREGASTILEFAPASDYHYRAPLGSGNLVRAVNYSVEVFKPGTNADRGESFEIEFRVDSQFGQAQPP